MAPERPTYRLFDIDIVDLAHCRLANFAPFCSQWKHSPDQRCNEEASYFSSGVSDLVEREFVARQRLIQAGADNTRQAPQYYPLLITAPRIVIEFLLDYARLSNYLPTSAKYVVACEDISLPEGTMATRMDVAGRSLKALCESLPSSGQESSKTVIFTTAEYVNSCPGLTSHQPKRKPYAKPPASLFTMDVPNRRFPFAVLEFDTLCIEGLYQLWASSASRGAGKRPATARDAAPVMGIVAKQLRDAVLSHRREVADRASELRTTPEFNPVVFLMPEQAIWYLAAHSTGFISLLTAGAVREVCVAFGPAGPAMASLARAMPDSRTSHIKPYRELARWCEGARRLGDSEEGSAVILTTSEAASCMPVLACNPPTQDLAGEADHKRLLGPRVSGGDYSEAEEWLSSAEQGSDPGRSGTGGFASIDEVLDDVMKDVRDTLYVHEYDVAERVAFWETTMSFHPVVLPMPPRVLGLVQRTMCAGGSPHPALPTTSDIRILCWVPGRLDGHDDDSGRSQYLIREDDLVAWCNRLDARDPQSGRIVILACTDRRLPEGILPEY